MYHFNNVPCGDPTEVMCCMRRLVHTCWHIDGTSRDLILMTVLHSTRPGDRTQSPGSATLLEVELNIKLCFLCCPEIFMVKLCFAFLKDTTAVAAEPHFRSVKAASLCHSSKTSSCLTSRVNACCEAANEGTSYYLNNMHFK